MGPVLVLGNKSDTCLAVSEEALKTAFGLHDKTTGKVSTSHDHYNLYNRLLVKYLVLLLSNFY